MKKLTLRSPVAIATLISVVVVSAAVLLLARSLRHEAASWERVVHTREVLLHVETALTLVSDAESAQRGFLLTGNEAFAATFQAARAAVPHQLTGLLELTRDNPTQQAALQPFNQAMLERFQMLERVMQRSRAGIAPDVAALESGRLSKERVLAHAARIRAEEERLLAERQARVASARGQSVLAVAAVSALSVCLLILLALISSRDAARLRSQRAHLDATLRSIGEGVIATDAQGNVQLVNPVAEALTGVREAGAIGHQLGDVLHLRDQASGAALPGIPGSPVRDSPVLVAADGRQYVIELSATTIHPAEGQAEGTVLVFRDVSERVARERALAESEANYRFTIELNPQMPWKASPQGEIYGFSERMLALTGKTAECMRGEGWMGVVCPEDHAAMSQAWAHSLATGEPYDVEHRILTTDGPRWMRSRANPGRDEHGAIVAWYGLTEDVHARKQSELALKLKLAQIETIYRAVPIGLALVDADLRLAEINNALADMTGVPASASIGQSPATLLPAPVSERVSALLDRVRNERQPLSGVEVSADLGPTPEQQRDWLASFHPVLAADRVEGVVVALLEVTPIKAAQRALQEANLSLERRIEERTAEIAEVNAELRAFAHTVAHDLRAPLRNVEGFSTALLEDEADRMSADGKMFAERIVAAVVRMDRLITDLLAYSRLSRSDMRIERVDTGAVVASALRDLEAAIADSGAQVTVAPTLPAVLANGAILAQVFQNLVANAIKFVSPGTTPRVEIAGQADGATVRLTIADNGIGIAPEHYEHVFGVFERLHGHERYPGTGIGLAIVKKGLERMGGSVRIAPREVGTAFELTLPAAT